MSFATYLKNIQEKTGLSPEQFEALADRKGFTDNGKINAGVKATAIINWLKEDYGFRPWTCTGNVCLYQG